MPGEPHLLPLFRLSILSEVPQRLWHVTGFLGVPFLAVVLWSLNQVFPIHHREVPETVLLIAINPHAHHIDKLLLRELAPEGATVAVGAEAPYQL